MTTEPAAGPIQLERIDQTVVLRMQHGKASAMDVELCEALSEAFEALDRPSCRAVVLTGTGSIFSAGVDLPRLLDAGQEYLDAFLPALSTMFEAVFRFPKPVVAAVNGHAIAGGCVLTCACDRRLMAAGRGRIGVPELLVGVPFPLVALEIMRFATPGQHFQELIYSGATHEPDEAARRGLVDEVVPADELEKRAVELAERMGEIPAESFRITKEQLRAPTLERLARDQRASDAEIAAAWASDEPRAAIARYVEQTLGRRA